MATNPESRTIAKRLDSGFARRRAPRNDGFQLVTFALLTSVGFSM
jgi:hypothetical protein